MRTSILPNNISHQRVMILTDLIFKFSIISSIVHNFWWSTFTNSGICNDFFW